MGLDYGNTCPDIDKQIKYFKESLEDYLRDLVDECCPLLGGEDLNIFVKKWTNAIFGEAEPIFEKIRSTNSDMRKEADKQIEALKKDLDLAHDQISELRYELDQIE